MVVHAQIKSYMLRVYDSEEPADKLYDARAPYCFCVCADVMGKVVFLHSGMGTVPRRVRLTILDELEKLGFELLATEHKGRLVVSEIAKARASLGH